MYLSTFILRFIFLVLLPYVARIVIIKIPLISIVHQTAF